MMEQKAIDEVFTIIRGISFPKTARSEEASEYVGCLRTANIQKEILWSDVWRIPKQYLNRQEQLIKKDDIIVSIANSLNLLGKSAIVTNTPNDCTFGTFIVSLRPKDGYFPRYLYYTLQSEKYYRQVKSLASTTTNISNLSTAKLKTILLPIPSLAGQERIATRIDELFSELDAGVETLQKIKQQLAVYRQAVLKEAFAGELTETWRQIHPEETTDSIVNLIEARGQKIDLELLESIPIPAIPNAWKWVNLGSVSSGPEYGTSQKSSDTGKIPVIRMGNLQKGRIDWRDLAYTSNDEDIEKYRLSKGDVLFNRTNSPDLVGKTAIYRGEREAIFAGYLIRINQLDCIDPDYLTYYMNSCVARSYGNSVKTDGVNQSNINGKKLCSYPFPLCSEAEQKQVVYELESRLSLCDSIEKTVDEALQQSTAMRQNILKQAFGRITQ